MGKPDAPDPPDYAAAAKEQGKANVGSAIATSFLNQIGQQGPYGTLAYNYDMANGYKLPDGTVIPKTTATTTLSPEQQKLLDQQTGISTQLNDLASQGIGYVADTVGSPASPSGLPSMATGLAKSPLPDKAEFNQSRNQVTDAYMERLQPYIDRDRAAMQNKLANQGINLGSEAYGADNDIFNRGVNDQRIAALLAGDQEAQRNFGNAMSVATTDFGQGLSSGQFNNAARAQALQEQDYYRSQPLNMLNALRSGGQVNLPQFGNVSAGSNIAPAPIYQSAQDQYAAAMSQYQNKVAQQSGLMSGVAGIGSAAIMASDRRLKKDIRALGLWVKGLPLYLYKYLWSDKLQVGVMAQDAQRLRPEVLGPTVNGFMTVNYGAL